MRTLSFLKTTVLTQALLTFLPAHAQQSSPDPMPERSAPPASQAAPAEWLVYVGTYTGPGSKGIYLLRLNSTGGELRNEGLAAEIDNPSFLAIHPDHTRLYAVGELASFRGKKSGAVSAFAIDPAGRLTLLDQQVSGGEGPCHVSLDFRHRSLLIANYSSGTVAAVPLEPKDKLGQPGVVLHTGSGPNARRQERPHAHSINPDPEGNFALAADLGADKIFIYRLGDGHKLVPHDPPAVSLAPGSGPRHLAFHPNGRFVYVNNELNSTVTVFAFDSKRGTLKEIETRTTLPPGFTGENYTAEVQVHPSGKFVYVSNRGHDSLAIFAIDAATGRLTPVGHEPTQGNWPRNFRIDPTGTWLLAANQKSNSVVVFRVDAGTGKLRATGAKAEVSAPACIRYVPAGR